jgi:hypothetical protein
MRTVFAYLDKGATNKLIGGFGMDGKYLTSNIEPLKVIGDGMVFVAIDVLLNTNRFKNIELVAYEIAGSDTPIVTVNCLFIQVERKTLFYRRFDFYKATKNVEDDLKLTADHGIGIGDFDVHFFSKLRNWYLQNIEVVVEAVQ